MVEFTLPTGDPVPLKAEVARKFRGTRLPGSTLLRAERNGYSISLQVLSFPLFELSYRNLECRNEIKLNTLERSGTLRLEAVLTGELEIKDQTGSIVRLLSGQYHITDKPVFQTHFLEYMGCGYLTVYLTAELINSMGLTETVTPSAPKIMRGAMRDLIYEMLENPYDNRMRTVYYENCVRELVFIHSSAPPYTSPGELTEAEIAAVHHADRLIAENLNAHITIKALARRSGTNADVLKRGFQQFFGTGVFGRLLQRRMERAKSLLENTNRPIHIVGELAGYETVAGFITSFRKRFGKTPKDWRKEKREGL